jgi:cytochrome bd-type quinol oxidase subunit 2
MRIIILIAVIAMLLLELSDAVPKSSVGGPMTMMMIVFLAVLILGLYEAWSQKRGAMGWIVSIVAAVVGGFIGSVVASVILGMVLSYLSLGVPLVETQHPVRYIASAGMMLLALLGSWTALQIVNRSR